MQPTTFARRPLARASTAIAVVLAVLAAMYLTVSSTPSAHANTSSLTQVSNFGSNPGSLNMYGYRPTSAPASGAPLVLALHGCTQSANDYYTNSGWPKMADAYGFDMIFAEQPSATSPIEYCFDWGDTSNDARGNGEAESLYQMVQYAETNWHVDAGRIYITGLSAGAGMTADMLADYPDVFAGGSIDSGPAAQCSTSGIYNTNCTSGTTGNSVAQWGSLIRNSDSGYSGPYPRVAVWQGSSDTTVNPAELTYNMDGWTNVWGLSQTPSSTQSLTGGTTENIYNDSSGKPAVVTFSVSGMTHGLAVNPGSAADQCGSTGTYYLNYICSSYYTAAFWGLTGNATPSASASSSASPTATATATASASASPSPSSTYTPTCYTANNYAQTVAGRAYMSGGYVYANGSNQAMGLDNTYVTHTLEETSPGYYVIADNGCP